LFAQTHPVTKMHRNNDIIVGIGLMAGRFILLLFSVFIAVPEGVSAKTFEVYDF